MSSDCRSCDAVCSCKSQAFHCLRSQSCKCGIHSPETSISPRVRKIAFPGTACLCAILLQGIITHRICRKFVALGLDLSPWICSKLFLEHEFCCVKGMSAVHMAVLLYLLVLNSQFRWFRPQGWREGEICSATFYFIYFHIFTLYWLLQCLSYFHFSLELEGNMMWVSPALNIE